jgi:hypothetical protein
MEFHWENLETRVVCSCCVWTLPTTTSHFQQTQLEKRRIYKTSATYSITETLIHLRRRRSKDVNGPGGREDSQGRAEEE